MPVTDEQLREAFALFDADNSGKITTEELSYAMQGLAHEQVTKQEIAEMVDKMDKDKDGQVDFEEFKRVMLEQVAQADGPKEVLKAFQAFDLRATGEITVEDLTEIAKGLGYLQDKDTAADSYSVTPYDIKEIHSYCANNDDGKFSFYAWRKVMDEMGMGADQRGNAATYASTAGHHPVHGEDKEAIWKQLEEEEAASREKKREEEDALMRRRAEARERAKRRRASFEQQQVHGVSAPAEQKYAVSDTSWETQKQKLDRKRALQEQQRKEREQELAAQQAEMRRVQAALEEKRRQKQEAHAD
eukprot:TRINITY_DN19798_c0_g1_i1.p2 TRINITY_DN19798_c0_g1~~TRINITY_DN19798_c0_g1_i1.p2  ORF type:complete len:338 (+),score=177.29 TRINITY_DN19798_c0_g1_i1:109-1014(+)